MRRITAALACATALALSLAGCASTGPAAAPNPTAESPAPEAGAPVSAAARIVISSAGFTILAEDGTELGAYGYFDADSAPAIAALTDAFGAEPAVTQAPAKNQTDVVDTHDWSGFALIDPSTAPSFPVTSNFRVLVSVEQSGGVAIQTADGVSVGMPSSDVAPLAYRNWVNSGGEVETASYLLEQMPVEGMDYAEYEPAALSVSVTASSPNGAVESIFAPSGNWGD